MTDEKLDEILWQTLAPEIPVEELNRKLMKKMEEKGMNKKHFTMKKAVILVAAACLMIGTVSVASSGIVAYTISGGTPGEYTNFAELGKAESKAGYDVKAVENFKNGYGFKEMSVMEVKDVDEKDTVVANYNEISFTYEKEGADLIHINAMQAMHARENEERVADETVTIGGIQVKYAMDTYKWVPTDYEFTAEDEKNLERNDYFISYGADKVSETKVSYITWIQNDIRYSIMVHNEVAPEALFEMAEELINLSE